jgi:ketosteroid isomerase-like protein
MRNPVLRLLARLALVAPIAVACAAPPPPAPAAPTAADLVKAANTLDQAFVEAFNRGDAEALAALYSKGTAVTSFPPDSFELRGHEAILAGYRETFAGGPMGTLEFTDAHHLPAGDVVVSWGTWKLTLPAPAAGGAAGAAAGAAGAPAPTEIRGRFTDVKAERDGKWVYLLDHASLPSPPAPASQAPAAR